MNLIEAWKKAKEGQKVVNGEGKNRCSVTKTLSAHDLNTFIYEEMISPRILSDNWEIVKEKKKWEGDFIIGDGIGDFCGKIYKTFNPPLGTKIHITWEWEE